jgi:hypothetical protein
MGRDPNGAHRAVAAAKAVVEVDQGDLGAPGIRQVRIAVLTPLGGPSVKTPRWRAPGGSGRPADRGRRARARYRS